MKKHLFLVVVLFSLSPSFAQDGWFYLDAPIIENSYGALYPINENLIHIATDNGKILKSENGGQTWITFDAGVQGYFFDLVFYDENLGIAVGTNGAMLRTIDGGQTWSIVNTNTGNDLYSIAFTSSSDVWATGANGTLLHSTNSGSSWVVDNSLTVEDLYSVRFKDANTGLLAGANGTLFSTVNGGAGWDAVTIATSLDLFSIMITENYFRVVDVDGYIYFESNNLIDWEEKYIDTIVGLSSGFSFYNDNLGFYLWADACLCDECYLYVYKTTDGGTNWELSLNITTNAANCIYSGAYPDIKFVSEEVGYVLYGNKLFKTIDGGTYTVLDLEAFDKATSIQLFPNPTQDFLNILAKEPFWGGVLEIRNISGQEMYSLPLKGNKTTIDVSTFQTGMYFVRVTENGKVLKSKKFIKY